MTNLSFDSGVRTIAAVAALASATACGPIRPSAEQSAQLPGVTAPTPDFHTPARQACSDSLNALIARSEGTPFTDRANSQPGIIDEEKRFLDICTSAADDYSAANGRFPGNWNGSNPDVTESRQVAQVVANQTTSITQEGAASAIKTEVAAAFDAKGLELAKQGLADARQGQP